MFIHLLGDHLYKLGHRHIDCLNTQPPGRLIQDRIDQWLFWKRAHQLAGQMIDQPVQSYMDPVPQAYSVVKQLLEAKQFNATALLCITNEAATGAIRALYEAGLQVGKDVSVCAVDGAKAARYQVPSRTALEAPDQTPYLGACIEWMAKRNEPWTGPLLMQPTDVALFAGESTAPCPANGTLQTTIGQG
jgi:LacI family transcriptional regulator